ncbi:MAG: UDP-3-O-acyl-N-acetylglucosamine deacetylase, partial [Pseudomonadota bacterium]
IQQGSPRKFIRLLRDVSVEDNKGGYARLSPCDHLHIDVTIEFESKVIGTQAMDFSLSAMKFRNDICRARTFGFLHEVKHLRKNGLAQGGSLDNAIVINGDAIMNTEGLRYADEFVRHKILDCLGDLSLIKENLLGHYHGHRTGHALTNKLLRAVFEDPKNYEQFSPGL